MAELLAATIDCIRGRCRGFVVDVSPTLTVFPGCGKPLPGPSGVGVSGGIENGSSPRYFPPFETLIPPKRNANSAKLRHRTSAYPGAEKPFPNTKCAWSQHNHYGLWLIAAPPRAHGLALMRSGKLSSN